MKTQVFILFFLLLTVNNVLPQSDILNREVKIEIKKGTIGFILDEISTNGGFIFSYGQDIPQDTYVTLKYSKQTILQYLKELFGEDIYCVEYMNKLIIRQKLKLSEKYSIQGMVIDTETKEPIPGVTIFIPDSDPLIGSVSDKEGYFHIDIPSGRDIVQLSCIGYESSSIIPGQYKNVKVELNPYNHELKEVEIVYYKKHRDESVNSAVSSIPAEQLERIPLNGIEHALQGQTAGIHVVRNSGMPGSSLQVKIRGTNSLINSEPVYYLDGIYLQKTSIYAISPHDIESIEVLRDASITAEYGISAGNGVVLLNSKKANNKGFSASFDYYIGQQQAWKTLDLMTSSEFFKFYKLVKPDSIDLEKTLDRIYATDWLDISFHKAKTEEGHFSVNWSNKSSDFYFSTGFYKQEAIIKKLQLNRYSFKFKSDHKINQRIRIGEDISVAYLNFKGLKEGCFLNDFNNPILGAMCMLPYRSPFDTTSIEISTDLYLPNPYDDIELTNNLRQNYSIISNLHTQINLRPNIQYSTNLGIQFYFQDNICFNGPTVGSTKDNTDFLYGNSYEILDLSYDWYHSIEYTENFSKGHSLNASLGFEFGKNLNEWIPTEKNMYDNYLNIIEDTSGNISDSYEKYDLKSEFQHHGYLGSVQYNIKNRYYLSFSIRRDIIGYYENNNLKKLSEIYPSISLGWIFTKKDYYSENIINYGKLRYGWGKAGNSPRLDYSFYAKMMRDMEYVYAFNNVYQITHSAGIRQTNEKLYLENIQSHNVGLDLGMFKNKLFFSINYFNTHTNKGKTNKIDKPKVLILELNQMGYFGIHDHTVAEINNKGFEWELNYKHAGTNLSWDLNINFTHIKNKIIDIDESAYMNIFNSRLDVLSVDIPGEAAGSFSGHRIERLFKSKDCDPETGYVINQPYTLNENNEKVYAQPEARAGDYKFVDINNDSVIDSYDKTIIGNPFPIFSFGIFYNLQFKNLDFSMFLQGTYGNDIFNVTKLWLYNPYGFSNWTTDIENSYRPETIDRLTGEVLDEGYTNTNLHRFDYNNRNRNLRASTFYIEDGSYIRLKNIQLGYTLKPDFTRKLHIQKLRIYICAQNLLTLTNYSGLDPEVGGWGIDCGAYPQPRIYIAGFNVEF